MIVTIDELRSDILNRFENTAPSDFGVTKIDFPLGSESLSIYLEHYSDPTIQYKVYFEKILSYVVLQDYLQESSLDGLTFPDAFSSIFIRRIDGSKYMDYLKNSTTLKIFFEGQALEQVRQYAVYTQNIMIDVVTNHAPVFEIIEV